MAAAKLEAWSELLYEYLVEMSLDPQDFQKTTRRAFSKDTLMLPSQVVCQYVTYFLFDKLNHAKCSKDFSGFWPSSNPRSVAEFFRVAYNWLKDLSDQNPDARIPKFTKFSLKSLSGEKFCLLYVSFAKFVLQSSIGKIPSLKMFGNTDPSPQERLAVVAICDAVYEKHLSEYKEVVRKSQEILTKMSACAAALQTRRRQLKDRNRQLRASMVEANKKICEVTGEEDEAIAKEKLLSKNNSLLASTRAAWKQMEDINQSLVPSKLALKSAVSPSERTTINGDMYPVNVPPGLIHAVRSKLEQEKLFKIYEDGKLDFNKLLKFFAITLSTFREPLKGMSQELNVEDLLPYESSMSQEQEEFNKRFANLQADVLPSFRKVIAELYPLVWKDGKLKPIEIDGRSYELKRATPEFTHEPSMSDSLNDGATSFLLNVSPKNCSDSPQTDLFSSPDLRRRVLHKGTPPEFNGSFQTSVTDLEKLASLVLEEQIACNAVSKDNLDVKEDEGSSEASPWNTTADPQPENGSIMGEQFLPKTDQAKSPSLNRSLMFSSFNLQEAFDFSMLENQPFPDCPDFNLTSEIDASNFLLELSSEEE